MNDTLRNAAAPIRVGIIGAGTWAEYGHIPALKQLPQYLITAVFSRSAKKPRASPQATESRTPSRRWTNW